MRAVYIAGLEDSAKRRDAALDEGLKSSVPFVFFDEFDAPNDGVPLGWLKWFLAPMQDGVVGHGLAKFNLSRAIYFFAGGTSSTMEEFSANSSFEFKASKGPDFVSRLRAYLDISGPNSEKNVCSRRALIIRFATSRSDGSLHSTLSKKVQDSFFNEGRFKHGARSINSLIEMAISNASRSKSKDAKGRTLIDVEHLPPKHVRGIHADQGPLSKKSVDGLIGLSVGSDVQESEEAPASALVTSLVSRLWMYGATMAFGGHWNSLTLKFVESGRIGEPTIENGSRIEIFARQDRSAVKSGKGVTVVPVPTHWVPHPDERLPNSAVSCMAAYRMRWLMSCRCIARVVVAGKLSGFSGRMPGVFEETSMALSLGQPIYVIGGFGGASQVCGELLGLSTGSAVSKWKNGFAKDEADHKAFIKDMADDLTPSHTTRFPLLASDAVSYIAQYAYGGPLWPDNGLSLEENRELFLTEDKEKVVSIVVRGLLRRFSST